MTSKKSSGGIGEILGWHRKNPRMASNFLNGIGELVDGSEYGKGQGITSVIFTQYHYLLHTLKLKA